MPDDANRANITYAKVSTGLMCPHCGVELPTEGGLTITHDYPRHTRQVCPGSRQNPRSVWDRRVLWNGERPPERYTA